MKRVLMGVGGLGLGVAVALTVLLLRPAPKARGDRAAAPAPTKVWSERGELLRREALPEPFARLVSVHTPKRAPGPSDWMAHNDEPGQSFKEWTKADPVKATPTARTISMVRVGPFTPEEARIIDLTREYLGLHFQLPVKELEPVPASAIAAVAQRKNPLQGQLQWNTQWILSTLLPPLRPADSVSTVALTATDLWPEEGWNFVFGAATLTEKVGVWSIARHGDARTEPKVVLARTIKVAVHELGHMFSIHHCVAWECVMNGGNTLQETDSTPLEPCPLCLAKLQAATGMDVQKRFREVRAFLEREGLTEEAALVAKSQAALQ